MSRLDSVPTPTRLLRPVLNLVELLVAAMQTVGNSASAEMSSADRCKRLCLAQELMSEILRAKYVQPEQMPAFGPEVSDTSDKDS